MSMMQAGMLGVAAAVLAVQLKGGKAEYSIYVCVAAGVVLFSLIVDRLAGFVRTASGLMEYAGVQGGYLSVMFKMIGITYIAEFSAGICRDAGYQTLAGQIEIFAKLTILTLGIPVLTALLETVREFLS
ncbi:MAG TPA: stage III sporulation protein AD [Candidatus Mediterraneibacter merdipullorum]|nr:stage III sporulation protein AD [Candidatus Mediterraneibacter merdipullorum]